MTLTLDLPPELEKEALRISDLKDRLMVFVRQQVDLEQWRSERYSPAARQLVAESAELAEKMTHEEAVAGFLDVHERVTAAIQE
ncbi:MAG: hypothetical protein JNN17_14115 [Verrucomicrobiaceae bacterium]|nr:hypothetical protein [Verrucomicrobiaceae bacterium]